MLTVCSVHVHTMMLPCDSPNRNGPVGLAVCVYTFGPNMNDLDNVFRENYMRRTH